MVQSSWVEAFGQLGVGVASLLVIIIFIVSFFRYYASKMDKLVEAIGSHTEAINKSVIYTEKNSGQQVKLLDNMNKAMMNHDNKTNNIAEVLTEIEVRTQVILDEVREVKTTINQRGNE